MYRFSSTNPLKLEYNRQFSYQHSKRLNLHSAATLSCFPFLLCMEQNVCSLYTDYFK